MPSYDQNPYYNPESFDPPLRLVAEVEAFEPNWSFDTFIVVQRLDTGTVWVASDSGCSCPCPFEDHNSLKDDFTRVRSWADVKREYDKRFPAEGGYRTRRSLSSIQHKVVGALHAS